MLLVLELYFFRSTIINYFSQKKDRKEYGRCAVHLGC